MEQGGLRCPWRRAAFRSTPTRARAPRDGPLGPVTQAGDAPPADTPLDALYLKLFDAVAAGESLQADQVDMADADQAEVWKTVQVLLNKVIYTDSYLRL